MKVWCEYCGNAATTIDHVIPRSWMGANRGEACPTEQVPSCADCNSRLSNLYLHTLVERTQYIKESLKRRIARSEIQWPELEDFKELGRGLKSVKIKNMVWLAEMETRLAYPDDPEWLSDPAKVKVFNKHARKKV